MTRVVLLGTGNVASFMFEAFSKSENVQVVQVYNHSSESLHRFENQMNTTTSLLELMEADVYLMALKDDVIPAVAKNLKEKESLVVHTSGAVTLDALHSRRRGVFYPLQTFSRNNEVKNKDIPFCLEADNPEDLELLKQMVGEISGISYEVTSVQRKKLHLAAVFVCNFVNHLYAIGETICRKNDLPFEILQPLIKETAEKIKESSPLHIQTGPAIRRDESTIEAHLSLIDSNENKEIYRLLTHAIQSVHGKKL